MGGDNLKKPRRTRYTLEIISQEKGWYGPEMVALRLKDGEYMISWYDYLLYPPSFSVSQYG